MNETAISRTGEIPLPLRESGDALLAAMGDLVLVFDGEGNCIEFHAPDEGDLVLAYDKILRTPVREALPAEEAGLTMEAIRAVLAGRRVEPFRMKLRVSAGERWYEYRFAAHTSNTVLCGVRNVSAQIAEMEHLRQSEIRFQRLFESLPDMTRITDFEGRFLDYNCSGDWKLPGGLESELEHKAQIGERMWSNFPLQQEDLFKRWRELRDESLRFRLPRTLDYSLQCLLTRETKRELLLIENEVERISTIVKQLLEFSRISPMDDLSLIDLARVAEKALRLSEAMLKKERVRVNTSFPKRPLLVQGHTGRLEQESVANSRLQIQNRWNLEL